jgi:hypothetical protein
MNKVPRFALVGSILIGSAGLLLGAAGPMVDQPGDPTFGVHVATCAQTSTGFDGDHNPSHHAGRADHHPGSDDHC